MTEKQRNQLFEIRKALDSFVSKIVENPQEINENPVVIRSWKPGNYVINDIRVYKNIPYKCVQAHDSSANMDWAPDTQPALWMQYHGTTVQTARPWVTPTGAHDMYKTDEYVIWSDDLVYRCKVDTIYDPITMPTSWEKIVAN